MTGKGKAFAMETIRILDKTFTTYLKYDDIEKRIIEVANRLNDDLRGKDPIFLGILNGSFMFSAELFKHITIDCNISFLKLASYSGTNSTGKIKQLIGLSEDISQRTVVILEDIVDTGITIENIVKQLSGFAPKQILITTLLYKPDSYKYNMPVDYYCFKIPNDFIVGFGLDYNGYGRNSKDIYVISE